MKSKQQFSIERVAKKKKNTNQTQSNVHGCVYVCVRVSMTHYTYTPTRNNDNNDQLLMVSVKKCERNAKEQLSKCK